MTEGLSERSERVEKKFFGWFRRKQKERSVQGAGITPEAVPSKGREERNTGDRQRDSKGGVAGLRNATAERAWWV